MSLLTSTKTQYANLAARADWLEPVALLFARLAVARVFFMSGLNKWNGFFSFNPTSYDVFMYEFFCPEESRGRALILCQDQVNGIYSPGMQWAVERFANLAGIMEIVLPILLILGLLGRFSALGLLAMTAFIELFVFPGADSWWGSHVWWAAALLVVIARGPGAFSLDRLFGLERARD